MTARALLSRGFSALTLAEVDTPFLDAVVLLAHALGSTKERLFAALPDPVPDGMEAAYKELVDRRAAGTPVSYIRGKKEFFGLEFSVDPRVLVPRPDTEILVERALEICRSAGGVQSVLDACAGSGCVGIALKLCMPELSVSASDVSADAARVLAANSAALLGEPLPFHLSDLLESVPGTFDLITANPPYLRDAEVDDLRKMGWPEPEIALRGGADGMEIAGRLIETAPAKLRPGGWLALEAAPDQCGALTDRMRAAGFVSVGTDRDLAGRDRVVSGSLGSGGTADHA